MQFKSIKSKIAVLSGLCVLTAVGGLLGYGVISSQSRQSFITENVSSLTEDLTRDGLKRLASTQAGIIRASLDEAFGAARNMARSFEMAASQKDGTPADTRRAQFNAILLNVLKDNPRFNGTYSAWEPNAIDGNDAGFKNNAGAGSDTTGRFLPYWTRAADGKIAIQPLVEYDSSATHPNGLVKGGWYIGPATTGKESLLAPLPYIVQGRNVYLATMSVPIMVDGKFAGVAGADFDLAFVQKLAESVKASIYDGKASVDIVTSAGLVVASSEHADKIGGAYSAVRGDVAKVLPDIAKGAESVVADDNAFTAIAPIANGRTQSTWSVVVDVPRGVALAKAAGLRDALSSRNTQDMTLQAIVSAVMAILGIVAMWVVAGGIAGPIGAMTAAMRRLAGGELQIDVPGAGRPDEIGAMAGAVGVFRENAIANRQLEADASAQRDMSEAERRRVAEAEHRKASETTHATMQIGLGLQHLADGDLGFRLTEPFAADFEQLRQDFNRSVSQLSHALSAVASSAESIDSGSREISRSADDLSKRTEQQAASLEETAAALDEITANVNNSSQRADEARKIAARANESATESGRVVAGAVDAIHRIEQSSSQIANIIGVIDEIAFQTNLLALNAGVEAARAGDAGKGFAVVAQEVRELAQRSAQAAREIKELIQSSTAEVGHGVKLVSETGEALKTIADYVVNINHHMEAIATSAREQAVGLSEVNTAVNQMDQVTQQNAAMVEEANAASGALADESHTLKDLIARFRLEQGVALQAEALRQTARAMAPKAAAPVSRPKLAANGGRVTNEWTEF
jgi:methyl-accepting chemotaxis protein